ncbi:MAG: hypothetical protein ETSY1_24895 [Candidatus Entotheonella factor]|uniref:DUF4258 domain-containing protein n=1 Tax=Entotheonella factor TaxID=1429438 RepID=W4LGN7_ENTF1|nr:MAG: hypothetical protein ETSY1_24895 [Candidatus Entotheonella factor]
MGLQSLPTNIVLTQHARSRSQQRGLNLKKIRLALEYGQCVRQDGSEVFYLGKRNLPNWLDPSEASSATGVTVVQASSGEIITAYRCARFDRTKRERGRRRHVHR